MDPASLLVTSHFNDYMPQLPADWEALEYYEDDVLKLAEVARSRSGISTLHEATNGDPSISARWHRYLELGADQELMASLRTKSGKTWGCPEYVPRARPATVRLRRPTVHPGGDTSPCLWSP